jgi:hypothetical protein
MDEWRVTDDLRRVDGTLQGALHKRAKGQSSRLRRESQQ